MTEETAVLNKDDGGEKGWRDIGKTGPFQPSAAVIGPQRMDDLPVTVEKDGIRGAIRSFEGPKGPRVYLTYRPGRRKKPGSGEAQEDKRRDGTRLPRAFQPSE
jgi:hypothetical protein